ncbi:poly(A)-specific ribonuclease [Homalodisca vitripennis]|nr:poly(A)-specific ribonuclease [Homalodisca vitripennis]
MLICADSHGRDLAWYLRQKLRNSNKNSKKFTPVGFVNPSGRTDRVLNERNIKEELTQNQDVQVIICGTNDVSKNEVDKALSGIKTTLDQVRDKRVVLVDIPNRYDLLEWSCINVEIRKTNTALKIMSKDNSNVIFVESSSAERHLHTAHGMHFNLNGKRWLAERICEALDVGDSQPASVATPAQTTISYHRRLQAPKSVLSQHSVLENYQFDRNQSACGPVRPSPTVLVTVFGHSHFVKVLLIVTTSLAILSYIAEVVRPVSFCEVLSQSLCPQQTTPAWCDQCERFQPTEQSRRIKSLPALLTVNCGMDNNQEKSFWQTQMDILVKNAAESSASPGGKPCRYGTACSRPGCRFKHPDQRTG